MGSSWRTLTVSRRNYWSQPGTLEIKVSLGHLDTKNLTKDYEFFLGDEKLDTKFKVIGSFENLMFIEAKDVSFPSFIEHHSSPPCPLQCPHHHPRPHRPEEDLPQHQKWILRD